MANDRQQAASDNQISTVTLHHRQRGWTTQHCHMGRHWKRLQRRATGGFGFDDNSCGTAAMATASAVKTGGGTSSEKSAVIGDSFTQVKTSLKFQAGWWWRQQQQQHDAVSSGESDNKENHWRQQMQQQPEEKKQQLMVTIKWQKKTALAKWQQ